MSAAGGRQRTDSTHVLAAVRALNRLEFVGETLRAALEALAAAAPDWMRTSMDPAWQVILSAGANRPMLAEDRPPRTAGHGPAKR